jgi:predicted negative regulator of RcsB-dependent stress response
VSVINKMLRDLDSRQAADTPLVQAQPSRAGIARDTLIVNESGRVGRGAGSPRAVVLLAVSVIGLAGAAGWWYLNQYAVPARAAAAARPEIAAAPAPAATAAPAISVPVPAAAPASAPVPVARSGPMNTTAPDISPKIDNTLSRRSIPEKAAKPAAEMKSPTQQRGQTVQPITLAENVPTTAPSIPPIASRQSAATEVLAQAQGLWSSGSQEAAMDLVREALTAAERSYAAGASTDNTLVLATLARELARMQLAQGQVSQTLTLLTRLEPALSAVPDIWAIRGNAAQRLGRHAESVAAYQMALQLRPNEPRWMLGAAVSLAAQGQTVAAAELAEKARAGGVLSPEVASYLRQLGVTLPER